MPSRLLAIIIAAAIALPGAAAHANSKSRLKEVGSFMKLQLKSVQKSQGGKLADVTAKSRSVASFAKSQLKSAGKSQAEKLAAATTKGREVASFARLQLKSAGKSQAEKFAAMREKSRPLIDTVSFTKNRLKGINKSQIEEFHEKIIKVLPKNGPLPPEDNLKEDLEKRLEQEKKIMENLNKAADTYKELLKDAACLDC